MEKDIYEMYLNGPFDWLSPLDMMTELFTGGPKGPWARKPHAEKIYEISQTLYRIVPKMAYFH